MLWISVSVHTAKWHTCTIARYGYAKWTYNVHIYIYIEHRNLETPKTRNDFLVQVRIFLLPLSLKVLRHKERDIHSFYIGFSISPAPNTCDTCPRPWRASESQSSSSEAGLNSTKWLFQNPQNPLRTRFRCMTSFTSTGQPFYRIFILTSMNDTSSPRAR